MTRALLLFVVLVGTLLAPSTRGADASWPTPGATWSSLRLSARKAIFKADATITAERLVPEAVLSDLRQWPEGGARNPDGEVARFRLTSHASFRGDAERTTWSDARGLLQDDGREGKRRSVRRFGAGALHQWKERGKLVEEKQLALDPAPPRRVVDLATLLWLATGLGLQRENASLDVAVIVHGKPVELDVRAHELAQVTDSTGALVSARRVSIGSADPDDESTLFGMQGDVDLFLDATSGMPLEMRGSVAHLGAVRVRVVATPESSTSGG